MDYRSILSEVSPCCLVAVRVLSMVRAVLVIIFLVLMQNTAHTDMKQYLCGCLALLLRVVSSTGTDAEHESYTPCAHAHNIWAHAGHNSCRSQEIFVRMLSTTRTGLTQHFRGAWALFVRSLSNTCRNGEHYSYRSLAIFTWTLRTTRMDLKQYSGGCCALFVRIVSNIWTDAAHYWCGS